jgi:hypothetical protein
VPHKDDYPFEVKKDLMSKVVTAWRQPVKNVLIDAEARFTDILSELVKSHFSMYESGDLHKLVG